MEKITIIGWYGTETIGDRAILAGILRILSLSVDSFELRIGSLYPVLTERAFLEDYPFYVQCAGKDFSVKIFNSAKTRELRKSICWCDILMMGGGPLMDLDCMSMPDYAFSFARSKRKKTILMGCGWGPLKNPLCIKQSNSLVRHSDAVIMRDELSVVLCRNSLPTSENGKRIVGLIDPAFFAAQVYMRNKQFPREEKRISINMRDICYDSNYVSSEKEKITAILKGIIRDIALNYSENEILLVPMHTFHIGGDDRYLLNKMAFDLRLGNVSVQNDPRSLEQTIDIFYNSRFCVGMRFHSILLQTMVNGKNYVIDYTDPAKGKTIGMMKQLGIDQFYQNQYFSLQTYLSDSSRIQFRMSNDVDRYCQRWEVIDEYLDRYLKEIKKLFSE